MKKVWGKLFNTVFCGFLISLIPACGGSGSTDIRSLFVVSPSGTGSVCTTIQPCSLEMARNLVRQQNHSMLNDIHISMLSGTYVLTKPIVLEVYDSGFNGHYINYEAALGASPVISGGVLINNWTLTSNGSGIYQASVPVGFDTRQLYVNGIRAERTRLLLQNAQGLGGGATPHADGYFLNYPDMSQWKNIQNVELVTRMEWMHFRCPVSSVTPYTQNQQQMIVMQTPCWTNANNTPYKMNQGLNWIENSFELLTQPGQWYLDKPNHLIYYIPRSGEDMSSAKIVGASLEQLIQGQGVHNVKFSGITFAHATWLEPNTSSGYVEKQAGVHFVGPWVAPWGNFKKTLAHISFSSSTEISLIGNQFLHLGGAALNFDTGSQNITIQGNTFADISGGAILFGDINDSSQSNTTLQNGFALISNNYFTQTGVEYESSVPIFLGYTVSTTVIQNEIDGANYSGISVGWGWANTPSYASTNIIAQNWIHDVMQKLRDGGGIYTLGSQPNSTITGNLVENIGPVAACATSDTSFIGYVGIYHDNGTQYFSDSQNVVQKFCGYWLLLQGQWPDPINDTYSVSLNDNYVDIDSVWCNGHSGSHASCNFNQNSVTNLNIFGVNPPPFATEINNSAGISSSYQYAKLIKSGPLY